MGCCNLKDLAGENSELNDESLTPLGRFNQKGNNNNLSSRHKAKAINNNFKQSYNTKNNSFFKNTDKSRDHDSNNFLNNNSLNNVNNNNNTTTNLNSESFTTHHSKKANSKISLKQSTLNDNNNNNNIEIGNNTNRQESKYNKYSLNNTDARVSPNYSFHPKFSVISSAQNTEIDNENIKNENNNNNDLLNTNNNNIISHYANQSRINNISNVIIEEENSYNNTNTRENNSNNIQVNRNSKSSSIREKHNYNLNKDENNISYKNNVSSMNKLSNMQSTKAKDYNTINSEESNNNKDNKEANIILERTLLTQSSKNTNAKKIAYERNIKNDFDIPINSQDYNSKIPVKKNSENLKNSTANIDNKNYQVSKFMFECLNHLRQSPSSYLEVVQNIYNCIKAEEMEISYEDAQENNNQNNDNIDQNVENENTKQKALVEYIDIDSLLNNESSGKNEKYILTRGAKSIENLFELLKNISENSFPAILWSDALYDKSFNALNDPTNSSFFVDDIVKKENNSDENNNNISNEINFFKKIKALMEGDFPPEIAILLLLAEQEDENRDCIIAENFEYGSCCFFLNEIYPRGVSLLVLGYNANNEHFKIYNENDLNDKNNNNEEENIDNNNNNEIDIDDPIFDCIDYKGQIVSGDFKVEGNIMVATFVLEDGSQREERIILSTDENNNN